MQHYKGVYRLKTPYDLKTNMFPREYTGQFADSDIYIDCKKGIQIFYYGKGILQAYIPSIIRGNNIVKTITEQCGANSIFDIERTDSEVLFKFKPKDRDDNSIILLLHPKTSGAGISPFSSKNLPKTKYKIPDEDLSLYKSITAKVPSNQLLSIAKITTKYLDSLTNKKYTSEKLKADMALAGLKGKDYIHYIGKWDDYLKYLEKNL